MKKRRTATDDAFSNGVLTCLAVMHSYGDASSWAYSDMLQAAGRDQVIDYAKRNGEMEWSGLNAHLGLDAADAAIDAMAAGEDAK